MNKEIKSTPEPELNNFLKKNDLKRLSNLVALIIYFLPGLNGPD